MNTFINQTIILWQDSGTTMASHHEKVVNEAEPVRKIVNYKCRVWEDEFEG